MSYMTVRLSLRLTEQLRRELSRFCKREHRPASDVAREAIRKYLASQELRRLREQVRPRAEARGFFTDEDVFKAVS
jgi:predicted transcriptional regulator